MKKVEELKEKLAKVKTKYLKENKKVGTKKTVQTKKLTEAKNISVSVVYLTNGYSKTVTYDRRNIRKFSQIQKDLDKEFMVKAQTDDYWIDDIWVDGIDVSGVDWQTFFSGSARGIDPKKIENFLSVASEDLAIKIKFLTDQGYDVTEENLDEVYVIEADDLVEGNFRTRFPYDWVVEQMDAMLGNAPKIIEQNKDYFVEPFARILSDDEVNGGFRSSIIGDYFVYSYMR